MIIKRENQFDVAFRVGDKETVRVMLSCYEMGFRVVHERYRSRYGCAALTTFTRNDDRRVGNECADALLDGVVGMIGGGEVVEMWSEGPYRMLLSIIERAKGRMPFVESVSPPYLLKRDAIYRLVGL